MTTTATQVTCPMHGADCELVAATGLTNWKATTVEIAPCASLIAQGWTGPQWVGRKTDAERFVPVSTTTVWTHREGLVSFAV